MDQEIPIPGANPVSIKQVKKLADRLAYTEIQVPKIVMDETIQWQDIIPESYGEDREGRFFLVTQLVTTITTVETFKEGIFKGKSITSFEPVCLCLFQRFPDKEDFVEFTSNTTGIFFRLSIKSFKEIVDQLDKGRGHTVSIRT